MWTHLNAYLNRVINLLLISVQFLFSNYFFASISIHSLGQKISYLDWNFSSRQKKKKEKIISSANLNFANKSLKFDSHVCVSFDKRKRKVNKNKIQLNKWELTIVCIFDFDLIWFFFLFRFRALSVSDLVNKQKKAIEDKREIKERSFCVIWTKHISHFSSDKDNEWDWSASFFYDLFSRSKNWQSRTRRKSVLVSQHFSFFIFFFGKSSTNVCRFLFTSGREWLIVFRWIYGIT